jgi:hypothetical protein
VTRRTHLHPTAFRRECLLINGAREPSVPRPAKGRCAASVKSSPRRFNGLIVKMKRASEWRRDWICAPMQHHAIYALHAAGHASLQTRPTTVNPGDAGWQRLFAASRLSAHQPNTGLFNFPGYLGRLLASVVLKVIDFIY